MRPNHVCHVEEREAHLRRDVVRNRLRQSVGRVLFTQPLVQLLIEPPGGLDRGQEHLMALRIEQYPLQLLEIRQDEIEQGGAGLALDVTLQDSDGVLAARDQLVDDGRLGLYRRGWWDGRRTVPN